MENSGNRASSSPNEPLPDIYNVSQRRGDPGKSWLTFLTNHREVIAAFDFFTVPTLTFQVLYCFFIIEHGRRKILHFNLTRHPTAGWVVQQLREAFPGAGPYCYVIMDRDAKFDGEVVTS
jgi:putative transposase